MEIILSPDRVNRMWVILLGFIIVQIPHYIVLAAHNTGTRIHLRSLQYVYWIQ